MTLQDTLSLPAEMLAVTQAVDDPSPDALTLAVRPCPRPNVGQVLIAVAAAGVNRPDVLQRQGTYPPPPGASDILGLEVAGTIAAVGDGVTRWRVGDRVAALVSGGGYAAYTVAPAGSVLPVPDGLSMIEAAALPEVVMTVWANVFERGELRPGETLLLHGANSGIGVMAVQMARAHGARVIATVRGAAKAEAVAALGADLVIDTLSTDFAVAVNAAGGADVILDMVGGDYVQKNIDVLNADGRLVQIAFQAGSRVTVDLRRVMLKRLTLTGSTLRARSDAEKARLTAAVEAQVWPWVAHGLVRPPIHAVFAARDVAEAHRMMDSAQHTGKIVLQFAP